MSGNAWPRRPQYFAWQGPVSGNGCIGAEVLFAYGRTSSPDPRPIDKDLRWRPGRYVDDFDIACYLMQRGFACQFYTRETDEDLLARGLDSIRDAVGDEWGEAHARYFTPRRVKELQEGARGAIQQKKLFPKLYSEPRRNATPADAARHLAQGHVVSFMSIDRVGHLMQRKGLLVPDADRRSAWLYLVDLDGEGLVPGRGSIDDMLRRVRYDAPVIAYWPSVA